MTVFESQKISEKDLDSFVNKCEQL